jgi:hypothetical protein
MPRQKFVPAHLLDEDTRIDLIGKHAMAGQKIGFHVDDEPGKADRYIKKLLTKFPELKIEHRFKGPTPGVETVIVIKMETPAS